MASYTEHCKARADRHFANVVRIFVVGAVYAAAWMRSDSGLTALLIPTAFFVLAAGAMLTVGLRWLCRASRPVHEPAEG